MGKGSAVGSMLTEQRTDAFTVKNTFVEVDLDYFEDAQFNTVDRQISEPAIPFTKSVSEPIDQLEANSPLKEVEQDVWNERMHQELEQVHQQRHDEPESEREPQFAFIGALPFMEIPMFMGFDPSYAGCGMQMGQVMSMPMQQWQGFCGSEDGSRTNLLHEQAWAFGMPGPAAAVSQSGPSDRPGKSSSNRWADSAPDPSLPVEWANTLTVMMRNLPNKYSQQMLRDELHKAGFEGLYDFLYLPIDPETQANKGYAFINFTSPAHVWRFKEAFEGKQMARFNSAKYVSVSPAALQGFEANYRHYSTARCNRGDPAARPLFLQPGGSGQPCGSPIPPPASHLHGKTSLGQPGRSKGAGRSLVDEAANHRQQQQTRQEWPSLREQQQQASSTSRPTLRSRLKTSSPQQEDPLANCLDSLVSGSADLWHAMDDSSEDEEQLPNIPIAKQPNFCPSCGAQGAAGHRFCAFCGASRA